jgi:hypothetical protein
LLLKFHGLDSFITLQQAQEDSDTKKNINLIEVESSEALRLSGGELSLIVKAVDTDVILMMTNVRIRVLD